MFIISYAINDAVIAHNQQLKNKRNTTNKVGKTKI